MTDAGDIGRMMGTFRCQRCDMPADICKGCVEKVEAEVASLKLQNDELRTHIERIGGEVPERLKATEKRKCEATYGSLELPCEKYSGHEGQHFARGCVAEFHWT